MLNNYLKVAFRNIVRYKGYSFINIVGMTVGIAVFLMTVVFAVWELSWENFHVNRDRIVRAAIEFGSEGNRTLFAGAMPAVGPAVVEQLPEVEQAVRFHRIGPVSLKAGDKQFNESRCFFVDSSVFDVFSFVPVAGDLRKALVQPYSVVLTERLAQKYFGDRNPLGQTLTLSDTVPLRVTGVIENIPLNSLLRTELMVSYNTFALLGMATDRPWMQWGSDQTYLLLSKGTDLDELRGKMQKILLNNTNEWFDEHIKFRLDKLGDIYLKGHGGGGEFGPGGDATLVYLLLGVGVLVLLIACLNYINITTARSVKRLKEISVRKVVGATRAQLIRQVLTESMVVALIAGVLGLVVYELCFPVLTSYLGSTVAKNDNIIFLTLLFLSGTVLFIGLLAGSVPAWFISGRRAVSGFLKGPSMLAGKAGLRRTLVVVQFALSVGLIFGSSAVYEQLFYMKNSDLGFDKKNVVLVRFNGGEQADEQYSLIKNELTNINGVVAVSGGYTFPGVSSREEMTVREADTPEDESKTLRAVAVDRDYLKVLGLELVEGQSLAEVPEANKKNYVVLSQSAVSFLGLENPVGQTLYRPADKEMVPVTVAGVVKDFHLSSLRHKIEPTMLYVDADKYYYVAVRIAPQNQQQTLAAVENKWNEVFPGAGFQSDYLEDTYDAMYQSEKTISELLALFTALAIFISCLGLLGLAAYLTEQRTKEIGIRKVLGASVAGIVQLLTREIIVLVLISNLIALPVAYYLIQRWLENFAYRVDIGAGLFLLTGGGIMLIALIAVSYQTITAAHANPVKSLRYE